MDLRPAALGPLLVLLFFGVASAQTRGGPRPNPAVQHEVQGVVFPEAPLDPAVLPDFSFSGRNSAAEEPPTVDATTHAWFDVTAFGAVPDDGLSDRTAIQAALTARARRTRGRP